jgi:threonine dehydrogenase-like Zn-dependent dehydrogenase
MLALWLEKQTLSLRKDVVVPTPPPGEALIKVLLSGICATDLELKRGYYPFTGIPGHEFVGEVVETSDTSDVTGRRVVGEINASCGKCDPCGKGRPTHCESRTVLGIIGRHGTFAEYLTLPVKNLHLVPKSVPNEAAVFTEPIAAALEIQEQVHIKSSERVLLIGAGRLGQLIAQTLALTGCELSVVARHPHQIEFLRNQHIQTITEAEIKSKSWDLVVEATGSPAGFYLARTAVRSKGTIVLKSTYRGDITLNISPLVVDEINIIGSRCGPFAPALRLLESKIINPTCLISKRYPLVNSLKALEYAAQPGVMKVLIENSSGQ